MYDRHRDLPHLLKVLYDLPALEDWLPKTADDKQWTQTSPDQQGHALDQVDVYLDDFTPTCQGVPK